MKTLNEVVPTSEQLPIISNPQGGVTLIRGAAGSGKTTTALLMLKQLSEFWLRHRKRNDISDPVRILLLTYNRTLRGYIAHLAKQQVYHHVQVQIDVTTFGNWAKNLTGIRNILGDKQRANVIIQFGRGLGFPDEFMCDEVEYCVGRFLKTERDEYLTKKRLGRGIAPRMERENRKRLIDEIVTPYEMYKERIGYKDWNDLACELVETQRDIKYDIIIADETQDFSANQIRAVLNHASNPCTIVFVLDAAQRIYPRGWTWREVGVLINPNRSYRLKENHRNTKEICSFAKPLLDGLEISDDGTIPDLDSCCRTGPKPQIILGSYSDQCSYAINCLQHIDIINESVCFAHPKAGGWFKYLRKKLDENGYDFVEMSRRSEWPQGPENIALISMHSAKGLEFDHVFILGLNEETTPHGDDEGDTDWENLRRLLAMIITRARQNVTLGYKPGEESSLVQCLDSNTYKKISL